MASRGHSTSAAPLAVSVELIGGRGVYVNGWRVVEFKDQPSKDATLLYLLATAEGHALPRSTLCHAIWPEREPADVLRGFPELMHRTRRNLARNLAADTYGALVHRRLLGWIVAPEGREDPHDPWLGLCPGAPLTVDVERFAAAFDCIHDGLTPSEMLACCAAALECYIGTSGRASAGASKNAPTSAARPITLLALEPLWQGAGTRADDLRTHFEDVRQRYISAISTWLDMGLAGVVPASLAKALSQFERLMCAEPLDDETARTVTALGMRMRGLLAAPSAHVRFLLDDNATSSPPAHPGGDFIGRERERARLIECLLEHQVVTITGAAGVGKTAFAAHVLATWVVGKVESMYAVPLAKVAAPGTLAVQLAIADALAVFDEGGGDPLGRSAAALRGRSVLLLLDNCEPVGVAVAHACQYLIERCPRLTILATSREPLGVPGEQEYKLPPLSLRPPPTRGDERPRQCEAVALFLRRMAGGRVPALSMEELRLIDHICARLDGLPLAIELAASQAALEGLEAVVRQLDEFVVSPAAADSAPTDRGRIMEQSIRRSYDWLSIPAQCLFRRLGVFVGGFDAAAATRVCADATLEAETIPALLQRLAVASLLVAERDGPRVRYRYLEVIRQFAAALLAASRSDRPVCAEEPEIELVRYRHAMWALEVAEREGPQLITRHQLSALRRLDATYDNLHAAIHWMRAHGRTMMELRAASHLRHYYWMRARFFTGCQVIEQALQHFELEVTPSRALKSVAADVMGGGAMLAMERNEFDRAADLVDRALDLHREVGDYAAQGRALSIAGRLAYARKHYWSALDLLRRSLIMWEAMGDEFGKAVALKHLGTTWYYLDECARAATCLDQSLALFESLRDMTWCGYGLINLANVHGRLGAFALADLLYLESLAIRWLLGARANIDSTLTGLAFNAAIAGVDARAVWIFGVERRLFAEMSLYSPPQDEVPYLEAVGYAQARLGSVAEVIRADGERTALAQAVAMLLVGHAAPLGDQPIASLALGLRDSPRAQFAETRAALRAALSSRERTIADVACRGATVAQAASALKSNLEIVQEGRTVLTRDVFARLATAFASRFDVEASEFRLEDAEDIAPRRRRGRPTNRAKELERAARMPPDRRKTPQ